MALTPWIDLRGGRDCWRDGPLSLVADDVPDEILDVAIVGAGVTGAIIADRLAAQGRRVVVLDRRRPATGSTAASTALVLWATDMPLLEHTKRYGRDAAGERWRAIFEAVQTLDRRARRLQIESWGVRPDLYLAGDRLDAEGLRREAAERRAAGLPSTWLGAAEVRARFGVKASAALVSDAAYVADPVALTRSLLAAAQRAGASVAFPYEVIALDEGGDSIALELAGGRRVTARQAILATGYEVGAALPPGFSLGSSFAIATAPGQADAWREEAMIWEASDPYLYLRTTPDGRIVIGGADEDFADPVRRDAMIGQKAKRLADAVMTRLDLGRVQPDRAWAATFGSSDDSLPAIGRRDGSRRVFVAHSFGGNGIAFAALAADLLPPLLDGETPVAATYVRPDRFA